MRIVTLQDSHNCYVCGNKIDWVVQLCKPIMSDLDRSIDDPKGIPANLVAIGEITCREGTTIQFEGTVSCNECGIKNRISTVVPHNRFC